MYLSLADSLWLSVFVEFLLSVQSFGLDAKCAMIIWMMNFPIQTLFHFFFHKCRFYFLEHLNERDFKSCWIQFHAKPTSCHHVINGAGLKTSQWRLTSCSLLVQSQLCTGPSLNLSPCLSSQWSALFAANGPLFFFLFFPFFSPLDWRWFMNGVDAGWTFHVLARLLFCNTVNQSH